MTWLSGKSPWRRGEGEGEGMGRREGEKGKGGEKGEVREESYLRAEAEAVAAVLGSGDGGRAKVQGTVAAAIGMLGSKLGLA